MADWHMAFTDAVIGDSVTLKTRARETARVDDLAQSASYGRGNTVLSLSHDSVAFLRQEYDAAVAAIEPVATQIERVGGCPAQRDLVSSLCSRPAPARAGSAICDA